MNPPGVVRVTAEHIAKGTRKYGSGCPIALAINESVGGVPEGFISVDMAEALLYPPKRVGWWRAKMPADAAHFIDAFDHGHPVEPFEFEVEWIDQDGVGA